MSRIVKFLKQYPPYNIGEGAVFEPHVADALVKGGVAQFTDVKPTSPPVTASPAPTPKPVDQTQPVTKVANPVVDVVKK